MSQRLNSVGGSSEQKGRPSLSQRSRLNIRDSTRGTMRPHGSREEGRPAFKSRAIPSLRSYSKLKRTAEKSPLTVRAGSQVFKRSVRSQEQFPDPSTSGVPLAEPSTIQLAQTATTSFETSVADVERQPEIDFPATTPPETSSPEDSLSKSSSSGTSLSLQELSKTDISKKETSDQLVAEVTQTLASLSSQLESQSDSVNDGNCPSTSNSKLNVKELSSQQLAENCITQDVNEFAKQKKRSTTKIPEPLKKQLKERSTTKVVDFIKDSIQQRSSSQLVDTLLQFRETSSIKVNNKARPKSTSPLAGNLSKKFGRSTLQLAPAPRRHSNSDDTSLLPSARPIDDAEVVVREITADLIEQTVTSEPEFELESPGSNPTINVPSRTSFKSKSSDEVHAVAGTSGSSSPCIKKSISQSNTLVEISESDSMPHNIPEDTTLQDQKAEIIVDLPALMEAPERMRCKSDPKLTAEDTLSIGSDDEQSVEFQTNLETAPVGDVLTCGPSEGSSRSLPDIGTSTTKSIGTFDAETQKKIKLLIKILEKYQIGMDLKLSLCIAAQWSNTLYPCLQLPGKEEGNIFSEDLPTVPLIIHFLKTQPQKVADYVPQLCWLAKGPRLELLQPQDELAALQRARLSEPTTRPSLMLRVVNDKYSAGEVRWQGVKTGSGTGFAFYPCSVEWAHAAIHAGLQPSMFTTGPRGPGLYLTEDPDACLSNCQPGFTWGKSRVGVQLRLALLVEFTRSGVSPCAGTEGPYAGARGDGGLLFAPRGELVRVRYLMVYVARPSRVPRAPPAIAPRPRLSLWLGYFRLAATIAVILLGAIQAKPPSSLASIIRESIAPVAQRVSTVWATI